MEGERDRERERERGRDRERERMKQGRTIKRNGDNSIHTMESEKGKEE